jgi:hypothetical protein
LYCHLRNGHTLSVLVVSFLVCILGDTLASKSTGLGTLFRDCVARRRSIPVDNKNTSVSNRRASSGSGDAFKMIICLGLCHAFFMLFSLGGIARDVFLVATFLLYPTTLV